MLKNFSANPILATQNILSRVADKIYPQAKN